MLGLPKSTELKKQLAKSLIYKKFAFNAAARENFDADVSRIDIVGEISPTTAAIAAGETVSSFFILLVTLKRADFDERNVIMISRLIKQNMLLVLKYEDRAKLAIYRTKLIETEWRPIEALTVMLSGLNLDTVWQNIIVQIGGIEIKEGRTLDEQITEDEIRKKLRRKIDTLERQAWSEKQPKVKFELVEYVRRLRRELEEIER